jgi:outer membrane protein assembly factor BamB
VVDFGRALARGIVRRDRSQTHNLRLVELRSKIREIAVLCRDVERDDTLVNKSPESYRAYASSGPSADASRESIARSRLRYSPKWTAAVPAIDLRATFHCGDAFIVGSLREMSCLDRHTGALVWRRPVTKGVSVVTPSGIARIDESGQLVLVDVASGSTRAMVKLAPRVGAPITGAVVAGAGLPRLLIVSEGRRHLSAIDLDGGTVLWRHTADRPGTFRLRRAGRLVVVSSGERALYALDVVTGEIVWRFCDRLRFASTATVTEDALFAIAGDGALGGKSGAKVVHLCPWSGEERWSAALPGGVRPFGSPLVAGESVMVTALDKGGTSIVAFDRKTGEGRFAQRACRGVASAMVVDDVVVANSESGELVALDTASGALRYRHVMSEGIEGDRPRRLEAVLRSGALFVPQTAVHVVRPSDGTLLGTIVTDLIPDMLRVDERCDVYVAEESGHVAAFGRAAELRLVR